MQMRRPHRGTPGRLEQPADRTVVRDRIRNRGERPKAKLAPRVGTEPPARSAHPSVLNVVQALLIALPDLEHCAGERPAVGAADAALHPTGLAGGAEGDVTTELDLRRTLNEERPEHRRLGRVVVGLVADLNRLHRRAQHIREQYELLAALIREVAGRGQEVDSRPPLLLAQPRLAQERVQVPCERLEQQPQPRVGSLPERVHDRLHQRLLPGLLFLLRHRPSSLARPVFPASCELRVSPRGSTEGPQSLH